MADWLSDALEEIYGALDAPSDHVTRAVLDAIIRRIPFATAGLQAFDPRTGEMLGVADSSWDQDCLAAYLQHYYRTSPWPTSHINAEVGRIYESRDTSPDLARTHPEFFHDWVLPSKKGAGVALKLASPEGIETAISFDYYIGDEDKYQDGLIRTVQTLRPHLARSVFLAVQKQSLGKELGVVDGLLSASTRATFLVDADAKIGAANAAGEAMLSDDPSIRFATKNRLRFQGVSCDVIVGALAKARLSPAVQTRHLIRPPTASRPGLAIQVYYSPVRLEAITAGRGAYNFVVTVLGRGPASMAPDAALLRAVFGLTVAEAEIAHQLCKGVTPDAISTISGRSVHTIRNQIKRIFSKLDCNSQSEVVSYIYRNC